MAQGKIRIFSKETLLWLLVLCGLQIVFYFGTGLYRCEYSLFEDHEIIRNTSAIRQDGYIKIVAEQIKIESKVRFRPVYLFYRIGLSSVLGDNIRDQHWVFYSLFVINSVLLFYLALLYGFNAILSFAFVMLVSTGTQTSIGWRLANAENIAIFFVIWALIFFLRGLYSRRMAWYALAGLSMALATLSKESFIFCLSFLPFIYYCKFPEKYRFGKFIILCVSVAMAVTVYIVAIRWLISDPDGMKYAGSSVSLRDILLVQFGTISWSAINLRRFVETFIFLGSFFQPYILLLLISSLLGFIYLPARRFIFISVVYVCIFLIGHKILYLRTILSDIYMYPAIIPICFLVVLLYSKLLRHAQRVPIIIMALIIVSVFAWQASISIKTAHMFALENKTSTKLIRDLCAVSPGEIIIMADPILDVEFIYGIKTPLTKCVPNDHFRYVSQEMDDSIEALRIMQFTDPSLIPFLREQFYNQFSPDILKLNPHDGLKGLIWIIIQRPGQLPMHYTEVENHQYSADYYIAKDFYVISVLKPLATLRKM